MDQAQQPETKPSCAPIKLGVVCGHLAFASYPLLVGHYDGDTFAGTEARLDQVLDGRLTARRRMGLYPGPIGSSTVVVDPIARPPGAGVIGLGGPAELSVGAQRRTLRRGLLAFAATRVDRVASADEGAEAAPGLGLSTLLIGAGEGGLDRSGCAQALLQAAAEAQEILARVSKGQALLTAIEIVELFEDRAVATWRVIDQALRADPVLARSFEPTIGFEQRSEARKAASVGRDPTWWQPIQITMSGDARERSLGFTVSGGLARAEARTVAANLDLVAPLVRRVSRSGANDDSTTSPGRALFELLWPAALKDHSVDERPRRLILDERSAGFPWELLDDRRPWMSDEAELAPPAVRAGMVRQLLQTRFREDVVTTRSALKALVIGNPQGAPTEMPDLPQAEEEAKAIATAVGGPPYVTLLAGATAGPEQITRRLFTDAWEIIHISAHGVSNQLLAGPDGKKKRRTGIVLGGGAVQGCVRAGEGFRSAGNRFHQLLPPWRRTDQPRGKAGVCRQCCHQAYRARGALRDRGGMGDRRRRRRRLRRLLLPGDDGGPNVRGGDIAREKGSLPRKSEQQHVRRLSVLRRPRLSSARRQEAQGWGWRAGFCCAFRGHRSRDAGS